MNPAGAAVAGVTAYTVSVLVGADLAGVPGWFLHLGCGATGALAGSAWGWRGTWTATRFLPWLALGLLAWRERGWFLSPIP